MPEVVELVATISDEPYRPKIPKKEESIKESMLDLMVLCWQEQHGNRPDVGAIQLKLKVINKDQ